MNDAEDQNAPEDRTQETAFAAGKSAAQNRWLLLIVGIVTSLAGLFAIAMPFLATFTATFTVGWVLIISGIFGLIAAFRRHSGFDLAAAFSLGIVSIFAGCLILVQPIAGIFALTTLIIAYFAASGALRIYYGFRTIGRGGGWMLAGGALSLFLAVMLFLGLPFSAAWVPGVLLGVDLLLWGSILIAAGIRVGRLPAGTRARSGTETAHRSERNLQRSDGLNS